MKAQISKAYRDKEHVGFKKTVAGRSWFLLYGTTAGCEAKAIAIATACEAKWQLLKLQGRTEFTRSDFEECKQIALGQSNMPEDVPVVPQTAAVITPAADDSHRPPQSQSRRWLHATLDEVVSWVLKELKADNSNADHVMNMRDRLLRARDAIEDIPLDELRRKQLDGWLQGLKALKSKRSDKVLEPVSVRNLAGAVRFGLKKLAQWEYWTPPTLWEEAFVGYTIKKLETPDQRKTRRKQPPRHRRAEKRILWHLANDFGKAMMALADWAGHTQNEIATLVFDDLVEKSTGLYIDRERYKTGVVGKWWIPEEAAVVIRRVIARTPRDHDRNPRQLAFLTPAGKPLVRRSSGGKRAKSDYVGGCVWRSLLRAASFCGVRHIPFKYMRKGMAEPFGLVSDRLESPAESPDFDRDDGDDSRADANGFQADRLRRLLWLTGQGVWLVRRRRGFGDEVSLHFATVPGLPGVVPDFAGECGRSGKGDSGDRRNQCISGQHGSLQSYSIESSNT